MTARLALAISVAIGLVGCPKHDTASADTPGRPGTGDSVPSNTGTGDTWDSAKAIAVKSGAAGVERWKDDVPFLFQAKGSRGVLVHNGAVITARGPAAAGAYLRDLGALQGKGPSPDSLLTLLYVLQAFPTVPGMAEQSAIDTLGPAELQPKLEVVNGHAHLVLHYFLPTDSRGSTPGPGRPIMRETLDIAPTGNAAWSGQQLDWTPH
jgi:hypothetical protein